MKNKLFILAGQSASGKSTMEKLLYDKIQQQELPIKRLISNTTRKPRVGEQQGVDYNFTTLHDFDKLYKNNKILEYNSFRIDSVKENWIYFTKKSDIDLENQSMLAIKEPVGISQLRQQYKDEIVVFYITCPDEIRKERYIKRGSTVDDVDSRFARDYDTFKHLKYDYEIINDGTHSVKGCADLILSLMKGEMGIE